MNLLRLNEYMEGVLTPVHLRYSVVSVRGYNTKLAGNFQPRSEEVFAVRFQVHVFNSRYLADFLSIDFEIRLDLDATRRPLLHTKEVSTKRTE